MKLINTTGMAIIGPGSEWLWAMLQFIALAITFFAIYRQVRLQRTAGAIEQSERLEREWNSERMQRSALAVLLALDAGTDPADLPYGATETAGFWERVGYLTRTGHLDRRIVENWTHVIQIWWTILRPLNIAAREEHGAPDMGREFEWLAATMAARDAQQGISRKVDAATVTGTLGEGIAQYRETIAVEEALRTMPVRLVTTPVPVTSVRRGGGDGQAQAPALGEAPATA